MNSPASKPSCAAESGCASAACRLVVNRIQRFCLQDGPGLRTTVFTQRCGLRCWWCHNPDTIPAHAPAARAWDVAELAAHCLRDERFWRHGKGGLTVSGGECLLQADPLAALFETVRRRGHHCTVDTAGHAPLANVQRVAPFADLWLWDLKAASPELFAEHAQGDLARIQANLDWLLRHTVTPVILRLPLIAGFNADPNELCRMAAFAADLPRACPVEILPGHAVGTAVPAGRPSPEASRDQIERAAAIFQDFQLNTLVRW